MAMSQQSRFLVFVLTIALTACGGGGGSGSTSPGAPAPPPTVIAAQYQGTWISEAYGRALEIGPSELRLLDYTSDFCLSVISESDVDTEDIETLFRLSEGELEWFAEAGTATFGAPGTRFMASAGLPASCQQGFDPVAGDPGYERDPQRELMLMAQLLEEYSVYPALRGVDVRGLYQDIAATLEPQASDKELAEALFELVSPYGDIHTTVDTSVGLVKVLNKSSLVDRLFTEWRSLEGVTPPLSNAQVNSANAYIEEQLELDRLITLSYADEGADVRRAANDVVTWFTADGIGYLAIDSMIGFGDSQNNADDLQQLDQSLDRAFTDLQDVETLIVDVRRNGGGRDFLSLALASRFTANEALAYTKQARLGDSRSALREVYIEPRGSIQYLGPVFLLTSAQTASGAEVFTLAMRELPQVTLVGEATQGGLSDQLDKRLTNGWSASVGNEFYLSVQGEWFEGSGIPVDIEIPQFSLEARLAGVDEAIEAIIEGLGE
ncbi:MAG: S41 family peptidase [Pseudomonadota bacterium]